MLKVSVDEVSCISPLALSSHAFIIPDVLPHSAVAMSASSRTLSTFSLGRGPPAPSLCIPPEPLTPDLTQLTDRSPLLGSAGLLFAGQSTPPATSPPQHCPHQSYLNIQHKCDQSPSHSCKDCEQVACESVPATPSFHHEQHRFNAGWRRRDSGDAGRQPADSAAQQSPQLCILVCTRAVCNPSADYIFHRRFVGVYGRAAKGTSRGK